MNEQEIKGGREGGRRKEEKCTHVGDPRPCEREDIQVHVHVYMHLYMSAGPEEQ